MLRLRNGNQNLYAITWHGIFKYLLVVMCVLFTVGLLVWFFEQLPIEGTSLGIDNIFYELDNWTIHYTVTNGLRNPPWSVLILVPIGSVFSLKGAWGVLVFATLAMTLLSVPKATNRYLYCTAVLLALVSFPSLRNIADANLEGLVIAGVLLVVAGYARKNSFILAGGILLGTVKPQISALLMLVLGVYMLQTWERKRWLQCVACVLVVVIPTFLWRGRDWLAAIRGTYQAGSIIDISLAAALNRIGIVPNVVIFLGVVLVLSVTILVAWRSNRSLSREKAGFLMCGSMLIAPYVAGNSILSFVVIAVIPIFLVRPVLGLALLILVNSPFFFTREQQYELSSYYWTAFLILAWAILAWRLYRSEILPFERTITVALVEQTPS